VLWSNSLSGLVVDRTRGWSDQSTNFYNRTWAHPLLLFFVGAPGAHMKTGHPRCCRIATLQINNFSCEACLAYVLERTHFLIFSFLISNATFPWPSRSLFDTTRETENTIASGCREFEDAARESERSSISCRFIFHVIVRSKEHHVQLHMNTCNEFVQLVCYFVAKYLFACFSCATVWCIIYMRVTRSVLHNCFRHSTHVPSTPESITL
jgi:hypothetical protein